MNVDFYADGFKVQVYSYNSQIKFLTIIVFLLA